MRTGSPGSAPVFDAVAIRQDFPLLRRRVYGKPLVYLDNAATTQKPHAGGHRRAGDSPADRPRDARMTTSLDVLYRDVILDHSKRPRNFRMFDGGHHGVGANPLCGDRLTVYLRVENETIQDAAFRGFGCAIAIASASLMTESVMGKTFAETQALFDELVRMITAPAESPVDDLGDLSSLAGVRQFPVRVKCATLPWQALLAATTARVEVVSTE